MPITQQVNSKGNVKKSTNNDIPFLPQYPVVARYEATSTAAQTVINMSFSVDQSATDSFHLFLDGKLLRPGSGNDYQFTAVDSNNTSSQVTLNYSIPASLNIVAEKLGVKKESEFLMDNRFVQLYESQKFGFNNWVNLASNLRTATTTTGTPAAGTFYSSIIGRAAITDISQDLKVSFGDERNVLNSIYLIGSEAGSSGEQVWGATNDDRGLVRFVGLGWNNSLDSNGNHLGSTSVNDYIEITFYGTGLNVLGYADTLSRDARVSVDGGSEGSNIWPSSISGVFAGRVHCPNIVINAVNNLTLGVHTVKIRNNSANGTYYSGYEVINASSITSLTVNPGIAYSAGVKSTAASTTLSAFNSSFESGTLGTRGGRALVYIKADGSIGKAINPAGATQLNMTAADHSNEEGRTYSFREFGSGRTDDWSRIAANAATSNYTGTLEDGTTSLSGAGVGVFNTVTGQPEGVGFAAGGFITISFVGTGVDIVEHTLSVSGPTATVHVDGGASIGTITQTAGTRTRKLVSGLPYGHHTVRIFTAGGFSDYIISKWIVYQPKKPTLPSGATELADYGVMANYAVGTAGLETIGSGLLRKHADREFTFVGASWAFGSVNATYINLADISTNVNGAYVEYTFFGTGFEFRGQANTTYSANCSVSLQNLGAGGSLLAATTANFPTLSSAVYGGFSFAAGTLSQAVSNTNGSGLAITNLPMSTWKVRITNNTSNFISVETFDIITPIYSPKVSTAWDQGNSLPTGSCAISDNRKFGPFASVSTRKNVSRAVGITSSPTTTSTILVPMPDMSVTHYNTSGKIKVEWTGVLGNSLLSNFTDATIFIDGKQASHQIWGPTTGVAGQVNQFSINETFNVSPGFHKIDIYWLVGSGTGTANSTQRILTVTELE